MEEMTTEIEDNELEVCSSERLKELERITSEQLARAEKLDGRFTDYQAWLINRHDDLITHLRRLDVRSVEASEALQEARDLALASESQQNALRHLSQALEQQCASAAEQLGRLGGPDGLRELLQVQEHTNDALARVLELSADADRQAEAHWERLEVAFAEQESRLVAFKAQLASKQQDSETLHHSLQAIIEELGGLAAVGAIEERIQKVGRERVRQLAQLRSELTQLRKALRWKLGGLAAASIALAAVGSWFAMSWDSDLRSMSNRHSIIERQVGSNEAQINASEGSMAALHREMDELKEFLGRTNSDIAAVKNADKHKAQLFRTRGMEYYARALGLKGENRQRALAEAKRNFEIAATLDFMNPEPHYNLGVVLSDLGERARANQELSRAIAFCGSGDNPLKAKATALLK